MQVCTASLGFSSDKKGWIRVCLAPRACARPPIVRATGTGTGSTRRPVPVFQIGAAQDADSATVVPRPIGLVVPVRLVIHGCPLVPACLAALCLVHRRSQKQVQPAPRYLSNPSFHEVASQTKKNKEKKNARTRMRTQLGAVAPHSRRFFGPATFRPIKFCALLYNLGSSSRRNRAADWPKTNSKVPTPNQGSDERADG